MLKISCSEHLNHQRNGSSLNDGLAVSLGARESDIPQQKYGLPLQLRILLLFGILNEVGYDSALNEFIEGGCIFVVEKLSQPCDSPMFADDIAVFGSLDEVVEHL